MIDPISAHLRTASSSLTIEQLDSRIAHLELLLQSTPAFVSLHDVAELLVLREDRASRVAESEEQSTGRLGLFSGIKEKSELKPPEATFRRLHDLSDDGLGRLAGEQLSALTRLVEGQPSDNLKQRLLLLKDMRRLTSGPGVSVLENTEIDIIERVLSLRAGI